MRLPRAALVALTLATITAACSTISLPEPVPPPGSTLAQTTTTTIPPDPADLSDRFGILLASDADGSLRAMWVDGSLSQEIAPPDDSRTVPTWSAADQLLYWGRGLGAGQRVIETVDPNNGDVIRAYNASALPFFLSPSPTGDRLAYLGPGRSEGIALGLIDFDASLDDVLVGAGEPFYFTWSPDGTRLAQHVGAGGVSILDLDELLTSPLEVTGTTDWTVPFWIDNRTVLAVHHDSAEPAIRTLAAFDVVDRTRRDIVRFGGQVQFVPTPDRSHVAIQATEQAAGAAPSTVLTSFFQDDEPPPTSTSTVVPQDSTTTTVVELPDGLDAIPAIPAQELVVVDLATGEITPTDLGQALAFTWSPVDDKLAALVQGDEAVLWSFWRDGRIGETPSFTPSEFSLAAYLPFFTQFAETQQWWSPDGRTFVFAGEVGDESGVWVQPVNLGAWPTLVDDGHYGFFAP